MRVFFTDFGRPELDLEERLLDEAGLTLVRAEPQCRTPDDVIRAARDAFAIVPEVAPLTGEVFAALPKLQIVSVPQIGVDTIDLEAAREHGVWVANVPDANVTEVACHALAMALSLLRQLPAYDAGVRAGRWDYAEVGALRRPGGLTFGLLGMGRIGRLVAGYAAPIFGRVTGVDPNLPDDAWPSGVERLGDPAALFRESDVVSLHMPLAAETRNLVDRTLLGEMKPGSFLVNVSRGGILVLDDLLAALDGGPLTGAALDVLPEEPPPKGTTVLGHPKVLLSPHAAFYSVESEEELRRRSILNILAYLRDGRPQSVVVEGRR